MTRSRRRLVPWLLAVPVSLVPFAAYLALTPEGRLVQAMARTSVAPPSLRSLSPTEREAVRAAAPAYREGVAVLAYHGLGPGGSGDGEGTVVSVERFGEQLLALQAAGMQPVTTEHVAQWLHGTASLPSNAVLLTFDDGRKDAVLHGDPLLEQAGMRATMFVVTEAADDPGLYYEAWDRLEALQRSGRWELQSHTHALHELRPAASGERLPALTSLAPGESLAAYERRVRDDLSTASAQIQRRTRRAPVAFAYPFGATGSEPHSHGAVERIVREAVGQRHAIAFHQRSEPTLVRCGADPLRLPRLSVGNWTGPELLERIARAAARTSSAGTCGAPA